MVDSTFTGFAWGGPTHNIPRGIKECSSQTPLIDISFSGELVLNDTYIGRNNRLTDRQAQNCLELINENIIKYLGSINQTNIQTGISGSSQIAILQQGFSRLYSLLPKSL